MLQVKKKVKMQLKRKYKNNFCGIEKPLDAKENNLNNLKKNAKLALKELN